MKITVLGRGCSRCETTIQHIKEQASSLGVVADITKITDEIEIVKNGVMTTPAVMINGRIVHAGGIPSIETIQSWLTVSSEKLPSPIANPKK